MKFLAVSLLLFLVSCNKETESPAPVSLQKTKKTTTTTNTGTAINPNDDFSDLKKKDDEHCDSEEELLKKQIEKAKKAKEQPIKLQGGDEGCEIN
ncbi:MAG: hypothetical protein KC493_00185 [Bacteriovoracaceae bacterium]|nr:hypothetical protein [Bacteriovoracaceae bacterium]